MCIDGNTDRRVFGWLSPERRGKRKRRKRSTDTKPKWERLPKIEPMLVCFRFESQLQNDHRAMKGVFVAVVGIVYAGVSLPYSLVRYAEYIHETDQVHTMYTCVLCLGAGTRPSKADSGLLGLAGRVSLGRRDVGQGVHTVHAQDLWARRAAKGVCQSAPVPCACASADRGLGVVLFGTSCALQKRTTLALQK
jgi:hypothetical protein